MVITPHTTLSVQTLLRFNLNLTEGTVSFTKQLNIYQHEGHDLPNSSPKLLNISNAEYAEVSTREDEYACVDSEEVEFAEKDKSNDDYTSVYKDANKNDDYASVDKDANKNDDYASVDKNTRRENHYGDLPESEYDILRKSRDHLKY